MVKHQISLYWGTLNDASWPCCNWLPKQVLKKKIKGKVPHWFQNVTGYILEPWQRSGTFRAVSQNHPVLVLCFSFLFIFSETNTASMCSIARPLKWKSNCRQSIWAFNSANKFCQSILIIHSENQFWQPICKWILPINSDNPFWQPILTF